MQSFDGDDGFRVKQYTSKPEPFAQNDEIRALDGLNRRFGFGQWKAMKRFATVEDLEDGGEYEAELHYWQRDDGFKTNPDVYID